MRTLKRDNLAEVHFQDAFVPEEWVLGKAGGGFPVLGSALDNRELLTGLVPVLTTTKGSG